MLKTITQCGRGIGFLVVTWTVCTFASFSLDQLRPVDRGELTCRELLFEHIAPRVTCELTGYHTDQHTFDLSVPAADFMGQPGSMWYVPILPDDAAVPDGLADVSVLLRVSEDDFEALESGSIRVRARYPVTDIMPLHGSRESTLLAQHGHELLIERLWILDADEPGNRLATWQRVIPFLIAFGSACLAISQLLPGMRETRPGWLIYGGWISLCVGLTLIGLDIRLTPQLNSLRPGAGAFLSVCGLAVLLRGFLDRMTTRFYATEAASVQALLAGSDDARIVVLPDAVRIRKLDGSTIEIPDEQVTGLALRHLRHVDKHGVFESYQSTLTLHYDVDGKRRKVKVQHWFQADQDDPLVPLSDRLEISVSERWLQQLDAGEEINVQGWILDRHALRRAGGASSQEVRLDEIRDIVDDGMKLKIYREQAAEPCITLAKARLNAHVLKRTLKSLLEQRGRNELPVEHSLGPVLFQRRLAVYAALGPTLAVSVIVIGVLMRLGVDLQTPLGATVLSGLGVALAIAAVWTAAGGMQVREHGLVVRR
jgi:hypothetical protein